MGKKKDKKNKGKNWEKKLSRPAGVFTKNDIKTKRYDEEKEREREQQRLMMYQNKCNHIDKHKNKLALRPTDEKYVEKCKICGAKVFMNPNVVNEHTLKDAANIIYSAISIIRMKTDPGSKNTEEMIDTLNMVRRLPTIMYKLKKLIKEGSKKKKDKKGKYKKDDKKGKKGPKRLSYI